ncbi:MAG: glycosyltransferase family 39 protein [Syntrophobacteraceae bacterium]|nr:glycosyltransferase family 39 protein [Syntrophobacteraceae bacterium]
MFKCQADAAQIIPKTEYLSANRCLSILSHPLLWVFLVSLPFYLIGVRSLALMDNDAMYPQIAGEMLHSGDWITPRLDGVAHFDKPPLVYWLNAASLHVLGQTEAAARIWPVLGACLTILVVGAIGASLYGKRAGWLSALVFSGCMGPYLYCRVVAVSADILLTFWTALAILAYIKAIIEKNSNAGAWLMVMFACFGLAGLTKSLYGFGLPIAIIGLHAVPSGKWKSFLTGRAAAGILLTAVIVIPWHVLAARANPDFLWCYFIRENFQRFTGNRWPRDEFLSAPLFLCFAVLWTFPWMGLLPQAVFRAFRRIGETRWSQANDLLICIWFLFIIALFTLSHDRLEYYSLPAIPALALLIGRLWDEAVTEKNRSLRGYMSVALAAIAVLLLIGAAAGWEVLGPEKRDIFQFLETWWPYSGWSGVAAQIEILQRIRIPTVVVLAGAAIFVLGASAALLDSRPRLACGLMIGIMAPIFLMANWGFKLMEPFQTSAPIVGILEKAGPVGAVVILEPHEYQWVSGMIYYSGQKVYILKDPGLHDPAWDRERTERLLGVREFSKLWESGKRVVFVYDLAQKDEVARLLRSEPARVIGGFGTREVLENGKNR